MKVPESIAMSIPAQLIPLAQRIMDEDPETPFEVCVAHSSMAPAESLANALIEHPKGSVERAKAVREMREFLSLVEFVDAA